MERTGGHVLPLGDLAMDRFSGYSVFGSRGVLGGLGLAAIGAAAILTGQQEACAALGATGVVATTDTSAPFHYTITLHNTGTTDIGSLWFAWTDVPRNYDFLPSTPFGISGPVGWTAPITH